MKWTLKVRNGKEKYHCIEFTGTGTNMDDMNGIVNAVIKAGGNVTIDMEPDADNMTESQVETVEENKQDDF